MTKDNEYKCPHDASLSVEEEDAMNWLSHMLNDTAERCGPSARMATTAHVAVGKILNKLHTLHELVHKQEVIAALHVNLIPPHLRVHEGLHV